MSFLDREASVAPANYNRWLVPPAALAIHMCIGQVYGFSVFKIPLTHLLGVTKQIKGQDWDQEQIAWVFSIAIAVLGLAAAFLGTWAERNGPRKVSFIAAFCFGGGFLVSAVGVHLHSIWLIYLGYGLLGGIGLGLGYIAPVSTLVKWFPDRPGLATGMAIMGFGGGALVGSPLSNSLMLHFRTPTSVGVQSTFVVMGIIYFFGILFGTLIIRVPPPGWVPAGHDPSRQQKTRLINTVDVTTADAMRAPQFYLLWLVLVCNTTAGIGILEQASPMIQEMFPARFPQAPASAVVASVAAAGGFVGLISLFNLLGRFFWASSSDYVGRKNTVAIFLGLNAVMFWLIPIAGAQGSVVFFVCICAVVLSIYGGGFSTAPAYLKDLFGTKNFGPIYGRLLTAWSTAGVVGPLLVNHIRKQKIDQHITGVGVYAETMHLMAGLLAIAFIGNLFVRPVAGATLPSAAAKE
jgi:MFS family permease